jgi:hypothetical protein
LLHCTLANVRIEQRENLRCLMEMLSGVVHPSAYGNPAI